jgi:hypothetical protein
LSAGPGSCSGSARRFLGARSGGGQNDDFHTSVLRLALIGQIAGDGLVLAATNGLQAGAWHALTGENADHGIGAVF